MAIDRPTKDDPEQKHKVSFAFCSPKRQAFLKDQGRKIVEGRLAKKFITINQSGRLYDIAHAALGILIENTKDKPADENPVPSWVRKAFRKNKIQYGLREKV